MNDVNDATGKGGRFISVKNSVALFFIITMSIVLFAAVAYVYMEDNRDNIASRESSVQQSDNAQQQSGNQKDRVIVREDGAVVHVGTCPYEGGCGDEMAVVASDDEKYSAKVNRISDTEIIFETSDESVFVAQRDTVAVVKVDLKTKETTDGNIGDFSVGDAVTVVLNGDTNFVERVYILNGVFE